MAVIDRYGSGFIVVDGKQYVFDVVILPDGSVSARKTNRGRAGSHTVTRDELESILSVSEPETVVIGTGDCRLVRLAGDVSVYLRRSRLNLTVLPTAEAVDEFNRLSGEGKKVAALIHVAC